MTLFQQLSSTAARLGHSPAVVLRDAITGERTELSYATLSNWVSKSANLLLDVFDAGLGAQVRLDLPAHLMAPVLCFGALATGAAVTVEGEGDVSIVHEADDPDGGDLLIGAGMAARPVSPPTGEILTVVDVLGQPDDFVDDPGDEGAWAIGGRTQATLLAEPLGGQRLLVATDRIDEQAVFTLARALPHGVGVVLARGFDVEGLAKVVAEERVDGA